jgi:hypothetical protein
MTAHYAKKKLLQREYNQPKDIWPLIIINM